MRMSSFSRPCEIEGRYRGDMGEIIGEI